MELSWILGRSRTRFTHAERAVKLTTKSGSHISFSDFCKNVIPPCDRLNPLLFNGHLQTAWTAIKTPDIPVHYKRKLFQADDIHYAGSFAVDFVVPPTTDADPSLPPRTSYFSEDELKALGSKDSKPMLVVLHGLSGGSHELYLRHVLEPLTNDTAWEACVVNSRGCANSKITTGILYNARATWDTRQVVKFLREVFPNRPLYGVGFSLGANILTNVCQVYLSFKNRVLLNPRTVHWRRRLRLPFECCSCIFKPLEPGSLLLIFETNMDWSKCLFESHGR